MKRFQLVFIALSSALGLTWSLCTSAQSDWPKQPIKLIAVFPPGGSVDQVARVLAPALSTQLGVNVVVENKGGASGSVGTAALVQNPDPHTFAVVFDTHAVNPALIPNLSFDTLKDIAPVALIGTSSMVLTTHANTAYKNLREVLQAGKEKKNISYGTIGSGSLGHLAMELLSKQAQADITHVPYKGGGPLINDAIAGHVPLAIGSVFLLKPHIDSKRLRPLAVTGAKRSPALPDVPTVAESGQAGFAAPAWWAVVVSAKTPAPVLQRMNAEVNKALASRLVQEKLADQGIEIAGGTSDAARIFIEQQTKVWAKVVKDNNIKAD